MATDARKRKRLETTLAAAVAHPVRSRCLVILAERVASPAELARELKLDVSKVGYHVNGLREANLIEEVRTRPVRGAIEHFYRAVQLPVVTSEQEDELSDQERRVYAESVWSIVAANATNALDVGTFLRRTDHHMTRYAFNTDEEGWREATAAYMELYERIFEVQEAAAKRLGESEEKPFRAVSFQALFETPPTGEAPGAK